eukprot:gene4499-8950_t
MGSAASILKNKDDVLSINWSDIIALESSKKNVILGKGLYGTVILAEFNNKGSVVPIAIKILPRSLSYKFVDTRYEDIHQKVTAEVQMIMATSKLMMSGDKYLVKPYGIVTGPLPYLFVNTFAEEGIRLPVGEEGTGVVMRLEERGSLDSYLHAPKTASPEIKITEKIRILKEIARGIAELHAIGIVHGDIKPENILLSHHNPPHIRLSHFKYAINNNDILEENDMNQMSLRKTSATVGTPRYCAVEMLMQQSSSINDDGNIVVTSASPKTDMYAYAIMAWEVLTLEKPFADIRTKRHLSINLHNCVRPPLSSIPKDIPNTIINMITSCWDNDISMRKLGYRIWYDQTEKDSDKGDDGGENEFSSLNIEPTKYINDEFNAIFPVDFNTHTNVNGSTNVNMCIDIGALYEDFWDDKNTEEEIPTAETISTLLTSIEPIIAILPTIGSNNIFENELIQDALNEVEVEDGLKIRKVSFLGETTAEEELEEKRIKEENDRILARVLKGVREICDVRDLRYDVIGLEKEISEAQANSAK